MALGRPLRLAVAGACALTLLVAGLTLSVGGDVADSPVRLSGLRAVTVVDARGAPRDVTDGDKLRRGDVVRTGAGGAAVLTVEARRVVLGPDSEVVVPDGASLDVRRGGVLLDRRRGPGLTVVAGEVGFDLEPGAVRVDRSFVVRVSVYVGAARVRTASGRQLTLTSLRTVGVAGRTLPPTAAPLTLSTPTHAWERQFIPDVVNADVALNRLASGRIDAMLGTAARARSFVAPFADVLTDVTGSAPASEAVLPVAIGRAARDRRAERTRVAAARALRSDGGSWGVVAALADARSGDVASRLDALLAGLDGSGSPVDGAGPAVGTGAGGRPSGSEATPGTGSRPTPRPTPTGSGPTGSPTASPSASPSPSPSSGPIEEIVDTIVDLIPTPTPSLTSPLLAP